MEEKKVKELVIEALTETTKKYKRTAKRLGYKYDH